MEGCSRGHDTDTPVVARRGKVGESWREEKGRGGKYKAWVRLDTRGGEEKARNRQ